MSTSPASGLACAATLRRIAEPRLSQPQDGQGECAAEGECRLPVTPAKQCVSPAQPEDAQRTKGGQGCVIVVETLRNLGPDWDSRGTDVPPTPSKGECSPE